MATADTYIGYREGSMIITKGDAIKNLVLYPPARPNLPIVKICKQPPTYMEESIHSPLAVAEALEFKNQTEDDVINSFINQKTTVKCQMLKEILDNEVMDDPLRTQTTNIFRQLLFKIVNQLRLN